MPADASRAHVGYVDVKRFVVSLDLFSSSRSLVDLRMLFDENGSVDSFDRDDLSVPKGVQRYSLLRIPSSEPDSETPNTHVASLHAAITKIAKILQESSPKDVRAVLNVAVFFDTANASFDLSASLQSNLAMPIDISISIYPVEVECSIDS